jgi:hypothetical protein
MLKETLFVTVNNSAAKGKEGKVMVISIITHMGRERVQKERGKEIRRNTVIGFSLYKKEREQEKGFLPLSIFFYVMLGCRLNDFERVEHSRIN